MKYTVSIIGSLLLGMSAAYAQVSSHAPTVFNQAPAQTVVKPAPAADKPVARVNGAMLTDSDLVREEYAIFPYARQHNGIPKEFEKQIRDGAMKMIIFEELAYQEAQRRKLTVSAPKLQRAEADFRKQFVTPEEYNTFLQSDFHGSRQLLLEKIRRSLLIETFLKTEVDAKSIVSPAEIRAFYDKNPARFHHPETFTFQTISILPPANATAEQLKEARTRAENALHQAKATKTAEEFGLLAEKISDDDYRVMMGQHKPLPVDQLAPQVVKAFNAMHPNDISGLIQVEQAYTIVRLQGHTPAGQTPFVEVKAQLQKELQQTKTNQIRAALDQNLRKNAKIDEL
ncbi:MAG TPA: peptidyl-prolyl cis-trans isomerase [Terracidiphilus sp.]|nr:peptidyl-prolyl cis-trans isomerase [Terracidiphilus sp.]